MSTPHSHIPPLPVRERAACMCVHGRACSSFAPGHALHLIQARLASATPSDWVDAIVESSHDGRHGGHRDRRRRARASRSGADQARRTRLAAGTPVALHERYNVLAVGGRRFNVAPLAA